MTTLHDRLADLAEDAPPGGPAPDLWDRGRRYHRRRRVGTLVISIVVVVLLAGLATMSWSRSRFEPIPAAPAAGSLRLPDQFFLPSPRTPAADDPIGPLVAVFESPRA